MNISDCKRIIENTVYYFDSFHDFSGINDRYRINYDVIIGNINGITYRITAVSRSKNIWKIFKENNILVENISLEEAIKYIDKN